MASKDQEIKDIKERILLHDNDVGQSTKHNLETRQIFYNVFNRAPKMQDPFDVKVLELVQVYENKV